MNESRVVLDENGFPVLLADVPDVGIAVQRKTGSEGGNPRHDARSGKFTEGPKRRGPAPPANVDPMEWKRMLDAVRDAAREFDFPEEGDIREFLAGRAKNPAQVDLESFMGLVREQIKTDLVDALDTQMRSSGILPRGRRTVRVAMPRGYTQRTMRGLEPEEIAEVMHRLEAKGHERSTIDKFFDKRVQDDAAAEAKQRRDALQASDQWAGELIEATEVLTVEDWEQHQSEQVELAVRIAREVVTNLPQPVVNVAPPVVNVEAPKPAKRVVQRDEKGLIVGVEEVPDDAS